jgi:hypothetical protein
MTEASLATVQVVSLSMCPMILARKIVLTASSCTQTIQLVFHVQAQEQFSRLTFVHVQATCTRVSMILETAVFVAIITNLMPTILSAYLKLVMTLIALRLSTQSVTLTLQQTLLCASAPTELRPTREIHPTPTGQILDTSFLQLLTQTCQLVLMLRHVKRTAAQTTSTVLQEKLMTKSQSLSASVMMAMLMKMLLNRLLTTTRSYVLISTSVMIQAQMIAW